MGKKIAGLPSVSGLAEAVPVVLVDEADRIAYANPAAERLWGLAADAMVGRSARALLFGRHGIDHNRRIGFDQIAGSDQHVVIERNGGGSWSLVAATRIRHGGVPCYVLFVRTRLERESARDDVRVLSLIAERTDRGVVVTDADRRIIFANPAFSSMLGAPAPGGQDLARLLAAGGASANFISRMEGNILRRSAFADDVRLHSSGEGIWVSVSVTPVIDQATGLLEHVVAVLADITHTRLVEQLQREVLAALAADSHVTEIMELLCRRVEALAPGVLCSILGVTPDERLTVLAAPSLPDDYTAALEGIPVGPRVGSCGTAAFRGEPVMVEDIATSPLWADFRDLPLPRSIKGCWSIPIKPRGGKVAATFAFYFSQTPFGAPWLESVVSACSDLCALTLERSESKTRIALLASVDTLTGLPNRARLIESLPGLLATARDLEQPVAALVLDVDHFKDVNDTLGHSTGDQLLVEMARRLKAQLRAGDLVGRTGGDEFVVLIHDCGAEEAARIAQRLLEYIAAPVPAQKLHLTMSASVGIAVFPEHGADAETLLKHADTAMHEAKRRGRGKFHFFTEDMNRRVQDRLVLSVALREAVQNQALRLVYQPQVSLDTGALHGVEALARWTDPVHGEVPPPRFIELAEEYDFIERIDAWGVEQACRQVAAWRAAGIAVPHVSVNLSPHSFRSGEIVGVVSCALKRHGLVPSDLRVEITERVMMDQHPNSFSTACAIEALGVRIAMDDFGTGYSSLSALSRLPIAELKIDRSFMLSIEQDRNALALATAVIRIGHSLGMTVVAEGVETAAQAGLLAALGCHAGQGYFFARPLAADDVARWLETRTSALC
ncbi:EAL domain-containing protein [Xanthobacter sp. V3C-3]|uniref:EAL domain-containing protein n=1 Tax=Xanthobacter lutulentifluminis TaxID=3119935 RepID=UPI003729A12D